MRLDPRYPPNYLQLKGRAALAAGNLREAAQLYRRARNRNPGINAWELGAVHGRLGRTDEAARAIEEYLRYRNSGAYPFFVPYRPSHPTMTRSIPVRAAAGILLSMF